MDWMKGERRYHYIVCLIIVAATFIVYSNTFHAAFHFDDSPQIVENHRLKSLSNLPEILVSGRGVTMVTFALNYAVGGLNVVGYHIVNTLIHAVNGVLVYILLYLTFSGSGFASGSEDGLSAPPVKAWRTGRAGWSRRVAAFAALLFAVHPIQTEAVTYIVQRMESLSSLFYLFAVLLFASAAGASERAKRVALYAGVPISYILGFYSKEVAVTLPAVILLYDLCFVSKGRVREIATRWPLYAVLSVLLAFFVVRTLVPSGGFNDLSEASAGFGVKSITPWEYLITQFNVILYYITLLIFPANQNLDYDFPVSRGLFEVPRLSEGTVLNIPLPPPVVSLIVVVAIISLAVYLFIRGRSERERGGLYRTVSFFILWFFIILSPTSSFIPIIDVIFEHRLYLASVGYFAIFALLLDRLFLYVTFKRRLVRNADSS